MATNKNQHFVPRCHLRHFTVEGRGRQINLFNLDGPKVIERAPVRHQCSGNYFYGTNARLEAVIQASERGYSETVGRVLEPGYVLTVPDRLVLLRFSLLQYMRTEAASRRALGMFDGLGEATGLTGEGFRSNIRDAVQQAMLTYECISNSLDDLAMCLFRNLSPVPFVTSDNPSVLTNRWYLTDRRAKGRSFGVSSAGNIILLPLSPRVLCLGYDPDVYSIKNRGGWVVLRRDANVLALNAHQVLNCHANIFFHDRLDCDAVRAQALREANSRPRERNRISYFARDQVGPGSDRYVAIHAKDRQRHRNVLLQTQIVPAIPRRWPTQIRWRKDGAVYSDGTAAGFVRYSWAKRGPIPTFRRERSGPFTG